MSNILFVFWAMEFQEKLLLRFTDLSLLLTNETLDKILPYEARAEFCQVFRPFFGQWTFKKNCFCDLMTFNNRVCMTENSNLFMSYHRLKN